MDKIIKNEPKDVVCQWIKNEIEGFRRNRLFDIAIPCRFAKPLDEYKNIPVFARAITNTEGFKPKVGDSFYYIYTEGKDIDKKENVKAFTEETMDSITYDEVNWEKMLQRNIITKIDKIFEAMKWDLAEVYVEPIKVRKLRKKKEAEE